jgi:hypothetical protein
MGQGLEEEMTMRQKGLYGVFLAVFARLVCAAQEIPLKDWTAPPHSRPGLGKAVDATPPRAFIGLQPCRILDTRGNGAPIAGGIFANSEARNYTITNVCGLPSYTDAVSVNFTVTGSPAAPPGAFLLAWPQGGPTPPVSILNFQAGETVANAAIVPLNGSGQITVNVSHGTHVIMDVNGYFSETPFNGTALDSFEVTANLAGPVVVVNNGLQTCSGFSCGLETIVYSNAETSAIFGSYNGSGRGTGVMGMTLSLHSFTAGVKGTHSGSNGVGFGVWGNHAGFGTGVYGSTVASGWGVHGASTGPGIGVRGTTGAGGAGVLGIAGSNGLGVSGTGGAGGLGVYFSGGLAGTGTKSFIEPHPTDPALAIKYVSLEGPEAGTYFRGRGKFQRGIASITVPETFRIVTAEEGLSVQITPIGEMASCAVVRIGLDEIVVKSSRNVEFFYLVHGVRRAYKNWDPVTSSEIAFRPESSDQSLPDNLSEDERGRLIRNGTYTKDGKVNLETARKLGWDKTWRKN